MLNLSQLVLEVGTGPAGGQARCTILDPMGRSGGHRSGIWEHVATCVSVLRPLRTQ
jgi:hypothetical protein